MVTARRPRISKEGFSVPSGFHCTAGMIGKTTQLPMSSATCITTCDRADRRRTTRSAYAYPSRSVAWKKTRHVVHTAAEPPNHGRICLAMTGWTRNRRNALTKMVGRIEQHEYARRTGNPVRAARIVRGARGGRRHAAAIRGRRSVRGLLPVVVETIHRPDLDLVDVDPLQQSKGNFATCRSSRPGACDRSRLANGPPRHRRPG